MTKQLKWWRDLAKEQRIEIMKSNNIEAVTFEEIKKLYENKYSDCYRMFFYLQQITN